MWFPQNPRGAEQPAILRNDPAAQRVLLQLIRDEDATVSGQALYALKSLPASRVVWEGIIEMLGDTDGRIHSIAEGLLLSFGHQPGKEVLAVLSELLQSKDPGIRTEALNIVIRLGPDAASVVPDLAVMLKARWQLRYYAARALKRVGPEARRAIPGLVAMLQDKEDLCREAAADALRHINPAAAERAGVK